MNFIEQGWQGHKYKIQAYGILEQCRAMKPGKDRSRMEQEAYNLLKEGERLLNGYKMAYKRIYGTGNNLPTKPRNGG